jgi:peptide/nickel transport system ATP-binding protein
MPVSSTILRNRSGSRLEPEASLLAIQDLTVKYRLDSRELTAVDRVSFSIARGEIVGLLGESGCGKTTTAISLLGLLPENGRIANGNLHFRDRDLLSLSETELRELRGAEISIIFQESSGLNPVMRVGTQVIEVLRAHQDGNRQPPRERVKLIFEAVGLIDFERIFSAYPHQLSGGERQRIAVAQALVCQPSLVIADEPTAHLDAESAREILACVRRMRALNRTSFLVISHDPELLAGIADRMVVMYAGQVVEDCRMEELFSNPRHPYTRALLECSLDRSTAGEAVTRKKCFPHIPGNSPDPLEVLEGCSFRARCRDRMPICDSRRPLLLGQQDGGSVRCFKYEAE